MKEMLKLIKRLFCKNTFKTIMLKASNGKIYPFKVSEYTFDLRGQIVVIGRFGRSRKYCAYVPQMKRYDPSDDLYWWALGNPEMYIPTSEYTLTTIKPCFSMVRVVE